METSGIGSLNGSTKIVEASAGNRRLGQEEFLKLLITQMTHQDPLSPQEDREFIAQMAQFSSLESMNTVSRMMSRLQGTSLLGKTIEGGYIENGTMVPISGVVTSVRFDRDNVLLKVNDRELRMDQVGLVRE
jgi:flagellar basal-body rod modification protein FlgD